MGNPGKGKVRVLFCVHLPPATAQHWRQSAAAEDRSLASLARVAITDYLNRQESQRRDTGAD